MPIRHLTVLLLLLPAVATAWLPGPSQSEATGCFSVDRDRRNDVLAFHHNIYAASVGDQARMAWTGSQAAQTEGTIARSYVNDVQRRINYHRALAGVPTNVKLNTGAPVWVGPDETAPPAGTTKEAASQRAALMFSLAGTVTHNPPNAPPFSCWTLAAWNAASHGNLSLGFNGAEAVDAYMRDSDSNGSSVWVPSAGHRRWLILPGSTNMGNGDVPAGSGCRAVNVLYVVPRTEEIAAEAPAFVAWPPAGWFPAPLMTVLWSLSYPGADFSAATVQVTGPGGAVPVTVIDGTSTEYGDPAITWTVPAQAAPIAVDADTDYHVTVSGIGRGKAGCGVPASHSYTVRAFDPERVNETLALSGPASVSTTGGNFTFVPVDAAVSHTAEVREVVTAPWAEGAEDAGMVIDKTSPGYSLLSSVSWNGSNFWNNGNRAFRLAFDRFVNPPTEA